MIHNARKIERCYIKYRERKREEYKRLTIARLGKLLSPFLKKRRLLLQERATNVVRTFFQNMNQSSAMIRCIYNYYRNGQRKN